jgi:hypothetical protein
MRYPLLPAPRRNGSLFEPQIHADFEDVGQIDELDQNVKILLIRSNIVGRKGAQSIVGLSFPCS